jgi:nucleoid DNA-binding protein
MNKKELVRAAAKESGLTQVKVKTAVDAMIKVFQEKMGEGNEIKLANFGTFRLVDRKAYTARNPKTQAPVDVPAKTVVRFRASKNLKETVNV